MSAPTQPSVLLVDDSEADRYLMSRLLRKMGHGGRLFEAENGQEAIEFLRDREEQIAKFGQEFPPLLVFLDINMPLLNGFEFLKEFDGLRVPLDYDSVVILIVTSSTRDADRNRSDAFDFVGGYVEKFPRTADDLRSALHDALGDRFEELGLPD